ncbi:hypothetical protein DITRI_Ditri05aG0151100 [Diplodiscus trichospermus]
MESQTWQRVAQEYEAMVVSLNNTLEQLREQASCCFNSGVDDAELCYEVNIETEENRGFAGFVADHGQEHDEERTKTMMTSTMTMVRKCYNSRSSCFLSLTCKHLCSCKDCAAFLDSCLICRTTEKTSIEALIS